jgi:acyl-CoA-binding protein
MWNIRDVNCLGHCGTTNAYSVVGNKTKAIPVSVIKLFFLFKQLTIGDDAKKRQYI